MIEEMAMDRAGIVVVSGASAGIGRAVARRFGAAGWRVALIARGVDGLEAARREIEDAGGEAMVIVADVADPAALEAAAERVEREWGPVDVWINNAMVTAYCDFMEMPPEDFRRATEVT
jgi:NAD(P)-dependent dehydrogenase (short-subunit alcohol dehydrogenase family)